MNPRRSSIVAIWAISSWPTINFIARNWSEVQRGGLTCLAGVFAITVGLGLTGHALHWYATRSKRGDLIVPWVVAICLFFGYLAIRNVFYVVFRRIGGGVYPYGYWLLCAAIALFFAWRARGSVRLQIAARTFSFVAAGVALVMLADEVLSTPTTNAVGTETADLPASPIGAHPDVNIYYIILDGYAGKRSLSEAMSFDNSPFLGRMVVRGFRDMSREHSNYLKTEQTIGGIFSLQYPQTDDPRSWNDVRFLYPVLLDARTPPPLVARLQADGYSNWFSGNVIVGCPALHVRCLSERGTVDAVYIAQSYLAPTPVGRVLMHIAERRRNALEPVAKQLPAMLAEHRPIFVFAHHTAPHPPYSLDRNCLPSKTGLEMWQGGSIEQQHAAYVGALECVNTQVETLVDQIVALDAQAMIVVQSDHGSDVSMKWAEPMSSWTEAAIRERASYLNLVRAPERCAGWLNAPLGQINTARFVLACAEGRAPDFLPEHTYISSYFPGPEGNVVRDWRPRVPSSSDAPRQSDPRPENSALSAGPAAE
jgi:hypothetical protein